MNVSPLTLIFDGYSPKHGIEELSIIGRVGEAPHAGMSRSRLSSSGDVVSVALMVNEMETISESSFASTEAKVYRFNLAYRLYHLVVGFAALLGAALAYHFLVLSVGLVLLAVFMIARPFVMAVTVDHDSVTLRSMFSENSIPRSSITAVEFQRTGKSHYLILWGNLDEKENLSIPDLFGFDEAWDDWLRSYRDLSDDKPLSLF